MLTNEEKAKIVKEFGKNEKDTGSPAVQIALFSQEIKNLTVHLKANKHDYPAKRALSILVAKRASLLKYLTKTDPEKALAIKKQFKLK